MIHVGRAFFVLLGGVRGVKCCTIIGGLSERLEVLSAVHCLFCAFSCKEMFILALKNSCNFIIFIHTSYIMVSEVTVSRPARYIPVMLSY